LNYPGQVDILPVESRSDFHRFIDLPYQLYKKEPNWVPPLRVTQRNLFNPSHLFWQKNPHQFFIAVKNGRCIGRIVSFVNRQHNRFFNTTDGFWGFLEAENDEAVFRKLFQAAEQFLKEHHCRQFIGPMNPDIHNELGILVQGFETPPYIMLTYNHPYYEELICKYGFSKLKDFYSYKMDSSQCLVSNKMEKVGQRLLQKYSLGIRTPDMNCFQQELEHFHAIYNNAFAEHWGFVPIPKDEFLMLAKDMKSIIDPRIVLILEYGNEPIAFLLSLPNINEILVTIRNGRLWPLGIFKLLLGRRNIEAVRVITVAVKKKYQHLGLGALLYPELMKRGLQYGYNHGEISWVVEDNKVMNSLARQLTGEPYKTYRIYSRVIDSTSC